MPLILLDNLRSLVQKSQYESIAVGHAWRRDDVMEPPNTSGPSYSVRIHSWSAVTTYWQAESALIWKTSSGQASVTYDSIKDVQVYKIRYFGSRRSYWRCVLRDVKNRKLILQASYCLSFRRYEDRSAAYYPFIKSLKTHVKAANPSVSFRAGSSWISVWDSAVGAALILLLRSLKFLGLDAASRVAASLARAVGSRLKGNSIARQNLTSAYPEKPAKEIEEILTGMWENLGRIVAEYAHLKTLWDLDQNTDRPHRIYVSAANKARLAAMQVAPGPAMIFGAHIGNWELLCWALGTRESEAAVVYRKPPVASVDRELAELRKGSNISYIPADINAPFKIKNALKRGAWIGLLVDEAFSNGVKVDFFGRPCSASPLFVKIARQFNCPVYGARIIRLPRGRFELDLVGPIEMPRDERGDIEVTAATRLITNVIEGWIREHPDQWLWFQRRWR
jgi:Kdo2-lipid IVA lauroyltransferase/acyltransferase